MRSDLRRLLVGVVAMAVLFEVGLQLVDGTALLWYSDLALTGAAGVAAAALAFRWLRSEGPVRRLWAWTFVACGAWFIGMLVWSWLQLTGRHALPFPSIADAPFVASPLLAGLVALSRDVGSVSFRRTAVDGFLAAATTLVATWSALLAAEPASFHGLSFADTLAVAHPVVNLAIAALVLVLATRWPGTGGSSVASVGAGWAVLGATAFVYALLLVNGSYYTGHAIDVGWFLAFGILAAVAAKPPAGALDLRAEGTKILLVLPYLPLLVAAAAFATGRVQVDGVLMTGIGVTVAMMVLRLRLALVENQGLARELEQRVADRTAELAASEARYRNALAGASVGSLEIDLDGDAVFWSPEAEAIHGLEPGAFDGRLHTALAFTHPDDRRRVLAGLRAIRRGNDESAIEYRIVRADGEVRWVEGRGSYRLEAGGRGLIVGVVSDVTARKLAEAELDRLAHTDALTGLPNRVRLLEVLGSELALARPLALLVMDLDGFRDVNDGLGHDTGDRFLIEVAARIRAGVRPGDLIARLGGDEFAIAAFGTADDASGVAVAERLLEALRAPVEVAGLRLPATASIGVAVAPAHGTTPSDLLRHADVAMYRAKQRGGTWALFETDADSAMVGRAALLADLRAAIDEGQIGVHFQPLIDVASGSVVAVEALARWGHATRGNVPPIEFIPLAEHSGLIRDLTPLVLTRSLEQCRIWRAEGFDLTVAVNVSPRILGDPDFAELVRRSLFDAGVPAAALTVEITESAFADETPAVERTLADLHRLGVRLSVDDFGTGYSSLNYLKRLPVDDVKLDRSFIAGLPSHADTGIVRAVLELARHLGLCVVAEGVETEDTLADLREWGCTMAQGYLIARPQPAAELTAWLAAGARYGVAVG